MFFLNISNESHQTQLDQKESKPIKTGGFTESVGWAHHNPLPSIHLGASRRHLFTLSRFAVVAGFGGRAEDEHVAGRAGPDLEQDRPQRRAGASSGRRPGRWGRSTGAPGQLEDRLPCLGGGHSEAFWDVWNLNHLILISILVGFLGTTFGVWFFVELFSVVFPNFSVVLRL